MIPSRLTGDETLGQIPHLWSGPAHDRGTLRRARIGTGPGWPVIADLREPAGIFPLALMQLNRSGGGPPLSMHKRTGPNRPFFCSRKKNARVRLD
jgi:hypothetical protein